MTFGAAGAGAGGAGAGAGGAPGAGTAAAAPGTGAPASPAGGAPPAGGAVTAAPALQWASGLGEKSRALAEMKRWSSPDAVYEAYAKAEQKLGAPADQLIRLPGVADAEGRNALYKQLGRPDAPDGYGFEMAEGGDKEFLPAFTKRAHELGFTKDQATGVVQLLNEHGTRVGQATEQAQAQRTQHEVAKMHTEWGDAFQVNEAIAGKGAEAVFFEEGWSKEEKGALIDKLEGVLGYEKLMKLTYSIGQRLQEHGFVEGGGASNGPLSPGAAQLKLDSLANDPAWFARFDSGDPGAHAEKAALVKQINAARRAPQR